MTKVDKDMTNEKIAASISANIIGIIKIFFFGFIVWLFYNSFIKDFIEYKHMPYSTALAIYYLLSLLTHE